MPYQFSLSTILMSVMGWKKLTYIINTVSPFDVLCFSHYPYMDSRKRRSNDDSYRDWSYRRPHKSEQKDPRLENKEHTSNPRLDPRLDHKQHLGHPQPTGEMNLVHH